MVKDHSDSARGRKEGNVLFNDALNTFYLRLYGNGRERGNLLSPHGLLFLVNSRKEGRKCFI